MSALPPNPVLTPVTRCQHAGVTSEDLLPLTVYFSIYVQVFMEDNTALFEARDEIRGLFDEGFAVEPGLMIREDGTVQGVKTLLGNSHHSANVQLVPVDIHVTFAFQLTDSVPLAKGDVEMRCRTFLDASGQCRR